MTRYRCLRGATSATAALILLGGYAAINRELMPTWLVIVGCIAAVVLAIVVLPNHRTLALKSLESGACPWCGRAPLRDYPDERQRWYCRNCSSAWTTRGKRVTKDD